MSSALRVPTIEEVLRRDNRIVAVQPRPDFSLEITYVDGESYVIDFSTRIGASEWTQALADFAVFGAVQISSDGRAISWPNGYDNCADALRWEGELARLGLSRADVERS